MRVLILLSVLLWPTYGLTAVVGADPITQAIIDGARRDKAMKQDITALQSSEVGTQARLGHLEDTKVTGTLSVRLVDTQRASLAAHYAYDMRNSRGYETGITWTLKLDKSYEERLIEAMLKEIKKIP